MVTVICENINCEHNALPFNVLGKPPFVQCGGCGAYLAPTDERDDPPMPDGLLPEPPAV